MAWTQCPANIFMPLEYFLHFDILQLQISFSGISYDVDWCSVISYFNNKYLKCVSFIQGSQIKDFGNVWSCTSGNNKESHIPFHRNILHLAVCSQTMILSLPCFKVGIRSCLVYFYFLHFSQQNKNLVSSDQSTFLYLLTLFHTWQIGNWISYNIVSTVAYFLPLHLLLWASWLVGLQWWHALPIITSRTEKCSAISPKKKANVSITTAGASY